MPESLATSDSRTAVEFARLQGFTEWWQLPALIAVCVVIFGFVVFMYRRDSVELHPLARLSLGALRLAALIGALVYFLEPQKRTERIATQNSRVLVMVDTSISMQERDVGASTANAGITRIDDVVSGLVSGPLIDQLRSQHDVEILRFDEDTSRLMLLPKLSPDVAEPEHASTTEKPSSEVDDWRSALRTGLVASGSETQLGQTLRHWLDQRRGAAVAGAIVLSDGGQNAGIDPSRAAELAKAEDIRIACVGIGSAELPTNVSVADFRAPPRAYPGDRFSVTGVISAQSLSGRGAKVELHSRPTASTAGAAEAPWQSVATQEVVLGDEALQVKFDVPSVNEQGRLTLRLSVRASTGDVTPEDNQQLAEVEIIDRKDRVLLLAGGPTREYQFLRNQLRRDKSMVVDVLLQTSVGKSPISQDANLILSTFPSTAGEIAEYDCIIAFDPNWQQLSDVQIDLLERWVAEMAGGLVVVAGPIFTDAWTQDSRMAKLRSLYPVEFSRRSIVLEDSTAEAVWPVAMTREGQDADFLWLGDTAIASSQAWSQFPGVYSFFQVRKAKPGATIYARFGQPDQAAGDGSLPVYMAGHFYAGGRVFYLGSGEMYRLRETGEGFFEQFYTKLIRYVSQGRLLRGSRKDQLMVEDRRTLGEVVTVRAQLATAQHEPLTVATVPIELWSPDNRLQSLTLTPDPERAGLYSAQFPAVQAGTYRLQLAPPEAPAEPPLTQRVRVQIPDLEREHPQRNDKHLADLATQTGGRYFLGMQAAAADDGAAMLELFPDKTRTSYVLDAPDQEWARRLMASLLIGICSCLCLEWTIRRLCRLA